MKTVGNHHYRPQQAFTLIEMLTVITIMAIVAGLVVSMAVQASQKKKLVAVRGDLNRLVSMIDNYYAKLNYYPPDNGGLISNTVNPIIYDAWAATNPLIYELIGATNTNNASIHVYYTNSTGTNLSAFTYRANFYRGGVANGDTLEPHNFFQPGPSLKEVGFYDTNVPGVCGLLVPVEFIDPKVPNFWHYDSSTTNRHNLASFDLWAEFSIGNKNGIPVIITNGNW